MNYDEYKRSLHVAYNIINYIKSGTHHFVIHWDQGEPKGKRGIARAEIVTADNEHLMDVPLEVAPFVMFLTKPVKRFQGDAEHRVLSKSFLATIVEYAKDTAE